MSRRDFANITVGDIVVINTSSDRTLHTITKVTKTQFLIESGVRFLRSDGWEYGRDARYASWATIPEAYEIADVHAEHHQKRAALEVLTLCWQVECALKMITSRYARGWGPTIEKSRDHLRRALEALHTKQETTE